MWRPTLLLAATLALLPQGHARPAAKLPDPTRVAALTAVMGPEPYSVAPPITNRVAWDQWARLDATQHSLRLAAKLLTQPLPDTSDERYLELSHTGKRGSYQSNYVSRIDRLAHLTVAEAAENKGRFLPALDTLITALCTQTSWVLPAVDLNLAVFQGKTQNPDLVSTELGFELATALHILGDKLPAGTRDLALQNIRRRVVDPFIAMASGRDTNRLWWFTTDNNWNAVCVGNCVGAALAVLPTREERAFAAAAGEYYIRNYLSGFPPDGYGVEGLGYWNYGFNHFVRLADLLDHATGRKIDLFAGDVVRQAALFPMRLEIQEGVYPAYGDCPITSRPGNALMSYLNQRLNLGLLPAPPARGYSPGRLTDYFLLSALPPVNTSPPHPPLRHWFENAEVLTERPAPGGRLGVSIKAGCNGANHGHGDLTSYVVVLGKEPILLDPGLETYTRRTFSQDRWQSKVLNSYGHPVPLVNGTLQTPNKSAVATILTRNFTDTNDVLALDIRSAYAAPDLTKLERTFTYSRAGAGSFTVRDEVAFTKPGTFGTALITFGTWKQTAPGTLLITQSNETLTVTITATGAPFEVKAETIEEDLPLGRKPTRLGINFTTPVTNGVITTLITP